MHTIFLATAGTYMGATYPTPFTHHFDPNAGSLLQAPYAAGPHATPTGTTYYATPPFFYWPYSSPPVSPNTCYSHQAAHNAATPMPAAAYHQTMYSLDLISAQINFATPTAATAMSPPSLAPQPVPPSAIKPHAVSLCTETYMTPTPQPPPPKAQIMTLLQFKQFSTPTVAPTVIPLANIKPTAAAANITTNKSSLSIEAECETVLPQTNQKQNAKNQQSQNINVRNSHNDAATTTSSAISSNNNSSCTSVSECDQSFEDSCNNLVTKNDMLSIDTTDAPHASVTVATTLNTSQTKFSMVAKPHLTSITGRTKQNVHKVC